MATQTQTQSLYKELAAVNEALRQSEEAERTLADTNSRLERENALLRSQVAALANRRTLDWYKAQLRAFWGSTQETSIEREAMHLWGNDIGIMPEPFVGHVHTGAAL